LSLQEIFMGLRADRCRGTTIHIGELDLQCPGDRGRNLVLNRKQVAELAVEGLRPQICVTGRFDQLGSNPDAIARSAHAAFKHVGDTKLGGNLGDVQRFTPERK